MSDIIELQKFLKQLCSNVNDVAKAENICQEAKRCRSAFVKVLATSVFHVCNEVQAYFAYYSEDVEKCFDGACLADEQARVWDNVFAPFQRKLAAMSMGTVDSGQLTAEVVCNVGELIDSWNHFPKEDLDQVLFPERTHYKT